MRHSDLVTSKATVNHQTRKSIPIAYTLSILSNRSNILWLPMAGTPL